MGGGVSVRIHFSRIFFTFNVKKYVKNGLKKWVIDVWSWCKKHDKLEEKERRRRTSSGLGFWCLASRIYRVYKILLVFSLTSFLPPPPPPPTQPSSVHTAHILTHAQHTQHISTAESHMNTHCIHKNTHATHTYFPHQYLTNILFPPSKIWLLLFGTIYNLAKTV